MSGGERRRADCSQPPAIKQYQQNHAIESEASKQAAIPFELRERGQFLIWRYELSENGKLRKVPYQALNPARMASTTNPRTWATFAQAITAAQYADGIGYVFSEDDPYTGVDFDEITPEVLKTVKLLDSYTERSVSGTGLHVIVRGKLKGDRHRKGKFEVYDCERYFCMTGDHLEGTPQTIEERQDELDQVVAQFLPVEPEQQQPSALPPQPSSLSDTQLIEKMLSAKNGHNIARLWDGDTSGYGDDDSAADAALCCHLAYWTGRDPTRIDALFRRSGLYREKWEREDYRRRTIDFAVSQTTEVYDPTREREAGDDELALADGFHASDVGNAQRLGKLTARNARYVASWQKWLAYKGGCWVPDTGEVLMGAAAREVSQGLFALALAQPRDERDRMLKHARACESRAAIENMIRLARSNPGTLIDHREFDTEPHLLNCRNGVVDLRTGELLSHDPKFLMTQQCAANYNPKAEAKRFMECMEQWQPNAEMRAFAQQLAGAGCIGHPDQRFIVHHGEGANGKSVFFNVQRKILGSYAVVPDKGLLLHQRHEEHRTIIADLFRRRLAVASESEQGAHLAEAAVKHYTGGETLKCRRMREDVWEFEPTHTLHFISNYLPVIQGREHAIWRRIIAVPWLETIPESQQIKDLDSMLFAEEAEGILRWMVEGAQIHYRKGLKFDLPRAVQEKTTRYRTAQDHISAFLEESFAFSSGVGQVLSETIQDMWSQWCREHGVKERPFNEITAELQKRQCEPKRPQVEGRRKNAWTNLRVQEEATVVLQENREYVQAVQPPPVNSIENSYREDKPEDPRQGVHTTCEHVGNTSISECLEVAP